MFKKSVEISQSDQNVSQKDKLVFSSKKAEDYKDVLTPSFLDVLAKHEGENIEYVYVDTKGNLTGGIGKMIPTKEDFVNLPLLTPNRKEPATLGEKLKDYERIKKKQKELGAEKDNNVKAHKYQDSLGLVLDKEKMKTIFYKHVIETSVPSLSKKMNAEGINFFALPPKAQQALIDMEYNMGGNFNSHEWARFFHALRTRDWENVAKESQSSDIGEKRNTWRIDTFKNAALQKQSF